MKKTISKVAAAANEVLADIDHRSMTEAKIERTVENQMNHLDRKLMNGTLEQHLYDIKVEELNSWANEQYQRARRPL